MYKGLNLIADFLLALGQADLAERNMKTAEAFGKLRKAFVDFLGSDERMRKCVKAEGAFEMDYELTLIVGRKVFPWLGKNPKNDDFERKSLPLILTPEEEA